MMDNNGPAFPKTLLVVAGNYLGGGQIFLQDVLQDIPHDRLIRYSFLPDNQFPMQEEWNGFQNIINVHPPESPLDFFKFKGRRLFRKPLSLMLYFIHRWIVRTREVKRIQNILGVSDIQRILLVLNSPFMINLANELIKNGNRIHAIVWDPPESFVRSLSLPKLVAWLLLRDFQNVIRQSHMLGTASDGMRSEYYNKYNKDSVVLIHSLPSNQFEKTKKKLVSTKSFTIGFAGNLYATKEWEALINALNSVDWIVARHKVNIEFLGSGLYVHKANPNTHITFWGWRSLRETIKYLSKVDVGYLPYWLDNEYAYTTKLTFPNKISVYLAAGIPILYHGPPHGSPAQFLSNHPVGLACYSIDPGEIIKKLEVFVLDKKYFIQSAGFIRKARLDEFNLDKFRFKFNTFLVRI